MNLTTIIVSFLLVNLYFSNKMLIVIDYQNDFLPGGALGKPLNQATALLQSNCTKNILALLQMFENDPVLYSADDHPADHVSFLANHLEAQKENPDVMEYLTDSNVKLKKVQLIYDKTTVTDDHSANTYEIIEQNYLEHREIDTETEVSYLQELWPTHCVQTEESDGTAGVDVERNVMAKINTLPDQEKVHFIRKGDNANVDSYSIVKNNLGVNFSEVIGFIKEYEISEVYLSGIAFDFCVLFSGLNISEILGKQVTVNVIKDATLSIFDDKDVITTETYQAAGVNVVTMENVLKSIVIDDGRRIII